MTWALHDETRRAMRLRWLEDKRGACSVAEADAEATLRERAGAAIGKRPRDMLTPLAEAGMAPRRTAAKRHYCFSFRGTLSPVRPLLAVKLSSWLDLPVPFVDGPVVGGRL